MTGPLTPVIVPVLPWRLTDPRLAATQLERERLARAFALDVVDAVLGCDRVGEVVIVTGEPELAVYGSEPGVSVVPDRPMVDALGLEAAVLRGLVGAPAVRASENPVLVVPADLPCLTSEALGTVLDEMLHVGPCRVPDMRWTGTTLRLIDPASAAPLDLELISGFEIDPRVRQDVDTADDLTAGVWIGLGRATEAALAGDPLERRSADRHDVRLDRTSRLAASTAPTPNAWSLGGGLEYFDFFVP